MNITRIVLSGLGGTTLMTLFSYIVSEYRGKNFKEPELIAVLLQTLFPETKKFALPAGWFAHYGVGLSIAVIHWYAVNKAHIKPDAKNSFIIGVLNGLAGVAIWESALRLHPRPPKLDVKRFYGHLMLAHILFSMVVILAGKKIRRRDKLFVDYRSPYKQIA